MDPPPKDSMLRFVPVRVDGINGVTEAVVYSDRIELVVAAGNASFRFRDMARWPRPAWFWRLLSRIGVRPRFLPIGERDWCRRPHERFIRFHTIPAITLYVPDDPHTVYRLTLFRRIQDVIALGGYSTFDLG